MQNAQITAIGF